MISRGKIAQPVGTSTCDLQGNPIGGTPTQPVAGGTPTQPAAGTGATVANDDLLGGDKDDDGIPNAFDVNDDGDATVDSADSSTPAPQVGVEDSACAKVEFKIFTNINSTIVDPKNFDEKSFVDFKGDVCIIPPNSFALARTVEYFRIPRSVLTICLGKSTYARCGIIVNVTPLEPEWEGHVTLEFSNTTTLPAKIYANEGIAQMLFLESDEICETSYADRGGKYQGQRGVTLPRA